VAPAFSLPRLGGGAPVTLASFRGSPVIVNFFASWCPDCRSELAAVGTVATQNAGRVAVVGIDTNDGNGAAAATLLTAAHADYPVGVDTSAKVATQYLLTALPVTYFVDAQGRIVGSALGPQSVASLSRWVGRLTKSP
jgi:thioredoxin-like negative regulator of GroEL